MSAHQTSARIYDFMSRARPVQAGRPEGDGVVVSLRPQAKPQRMDVDGWYHGAAIRADAADRKA